MPRVVHFDIDSDDPDRAAGFYTSVFGWKVEKWEGPMDALADHHRAGGRARHRRRHGQAG